jgi:hypothetical protein
MTDHAPVTTPVKTERSLYRERARLAADVELQPYLQSLAIPTARTPYEDITAAPATFVGGTDG